MASVKPLLSRTRAVVFFGCPATRQDDPADRTRIPPWSLVFANSSLANLCERQVTEAGVRGGISFVFDGDSPEAFRQSARLSSGTRVCNVRQLADAAILEGVEYYLLINGDHFPIFDVNETLLRHHKNRCDATLIDFPRRDVKHYEERVELTGEGHVHRIRRCYEGRDDRWLVTDVEWPSVTVLNADAMKSLAGSSSLPRRVDEWPAAMLNANLDVCVSAVRGRRFMLDDHEQVIELNGLLLRRRPYWLIDGGGLFKHSENTWTGKNVRIDTNALLVGPIAIGDDVEIGYSAVIVGPTTISRGSSIPPDIIVKRDLIIDSSSIRGCGEDGSVARQSFDGRREATVKKDAAYIRVSRVVEGSRDGLSYCGRRLLSEMMKRSLDIAMSFLALVVSLPLYPVIMLAIRISSPGPIFYGMVRQGRGGKNFRCWKFRTMVMNAQNLKRKLMALNEADGPQFKIAHDPRISGVGRILRKLNLDELPQFWNVLLGQMSIVGPRPSPEKENQMCPGWREARLSVRPGITGLWQVNRKQHPTDEDFQEWIHYDVEYVRRQSLWLDLRIFFKTFSVAFGAASSDGERSAPPNPDSAIHGRLPSPVTALRGFGFFLPHRLRVRLFAPGFEDLKFEYLSSIEDYEDSAKRCRLWIRLAIKVVCMTMSCYFTALVQSWLDSRERIAAWLDNTPEDKAESDAEQIASLAKPDGASQPSVEGNASAWQRFVPRLWLACRLCCCILAAVSAGLWVRSHRITDNLSITLADVRLIVQSKASRLKFGLVGEHAKDSSYFQLSTSPVDVEEPEDKPVLVNLAWGPATVVVVPDPLLTLTFLLPVLTPALIALGRAFAAPIGPNRD